MHSGRGIWKIPTTKKVKHYKYTTDKLNVFTIAVQLIKNGLEARVSQGNDTSSYLESVADGKDVLHVELVLGDVEDSQNPGDAH